MNTYTRFRPATGEIIGWCSGETSSPGDDYLLSPMGQPGSSRTQYVADGKIVSYTPEEQAAKDAMSAGWVWKLPERIAVDTRLLAGVVSTHTLAVDTFADLARLSVVGDAARIKEYERAQQHAEAYQTSGWALEPVPASVASWAYAKGWTAQKAAEDILAASARWYAALDHIRAIRLKAKEDIRNSSTNAQADTILATFKATLTAAMQGIA